jgi:hypothetical protein
MSSKGVGINNASIVNSILKKKINNYNLINTINSNDYKKSGYFFPPHILNLFISIAKENKYDLINFVVPANENIANLTSILIAMEMMKTEYFNIIGDYSKKLTPGINIELCTNGKIYKFMGESKKFKNFLRIETIPFKGNVKASIEKEIKNLFQFFPTKKEINEKNLGKEDWSAPQFVSNLDKILDIKTYNNPVLIQNNIILLSEKKKVENFFKRQHLDSIVLEKIISKSFIDQDGNIESEYEPLLLYTNKLSNIYEYFRKNKADKIIISDDISKLSDVTLINQISQLNKSKFMLFSNDKDYEEIKNFNYKKKHKIWKFEKKEIEDWLSLDTTSKQGIEKNIHNEHFEYDDATKIKLILENSIDQKINFIEFHEDIFDKITTTLKKIGSIKSENTEEINECIKDIYYLKHKLQDCLFGINDEILEEYNKANKKLNEFFEFKKKFFLNEEYDQLNILRKLVNEIDIKNSNFLHERQDELKRTLTDPLSVYNNQNTTIIADNPKIQIEYKKNFREKWNLDISVNTTQNPRNIFSHAIIPSELSKQRITKTINEHKFKNLVFFTTPSIKTKINEVVDFNKLKWKKFYLSADEKVKLCNFNLDEKKLFNYPEHINYNTNTLKNVDKKIDWDLFFNKSFDNSKLSKTCNHLDDIECKALIFYGDSYGYFSDNADFKVINNLLNSDTKKNRQMTSVNFKDLKVDDYILIRDSSDRDVVESEARLGLNSNEDYDIARSYSKKWFNILTSSLNNKENLDLNIDNLFKKMCEFGFTKSKQTLKNLINNFVICPDEINDLKILFKSLEIFMNKKLLSNEELKTIFTSSQRIKMLHRSAGKLMSKKIIKAISDQEIDISREAVRVDYMKDGTITLNSDDSDKPEAWIVQVQEIKKQIYFTSASNLGRVLF